jgi:hypothetical protein
VFFDGVFVVLSWLICGVFVVPGDTPFDLEKHASGADPVLRDWQVASLLTLRFDSPALLTPTGLSSDPNLKS